MLKYDHSPRLHAEKSDNTVWGECLTLTTCYFQTRIPYGNLFRPCKISTYSYDFIATFPVDEEGGILHHNTNKSHLPIPISRKKTCLRWKNSHFSKNEFSIEKNE